MRRSKVEMTLNILSVLKNQGPLGLTQIMYKCNFNYSVLKEYIDFLLKQTLVAERSIGKQRVAFSITPKGIQVLNLITELKSAGVLGQGTPFVIIKENNSGSLSVENGQQDLF